MTPASRVGVRLPFVVVASVVVVAATVGGPAVLAPASAASPQLSIANVSLNPDQPAPGEFTEATITLRNAQASSSAVEVTDVYLRRPGSARDVARVEDLGTVAVGSDLPVPLMLRFDEPGMKKLRVHVLGETSSNQYVRLTYPVSVVVRETGPQVNLRVSEAAVGRTTVTVNVSNGGRTALRNVDLDLDGTNVSVENRQRQSALVAAGSARSYTYTGRFADATRSTLEATLEYTATQGQRRTVTASRTVDLDANPPATDHPRIEVDAADALPGASRPLNVTVANGLSRELRQLSVRVASGSVTLAQQTRVRARIGPGETETVTVPARVDEPGPHDVNVTLSYVDDGVRRQVSRTLRADFAAPANPGAVQLTGVSATQRGSTLEVSATASNVGGSDVEGVVVSVADTARVDGADYFVGGVDASDFASFTLETRATGNVSAVPVDVRYVTDGVERTVTTDVRVQQAVVERPGDGQGGPPLVPIAGVVVVLALVAAGYWWRR